LSRTYGVLLADDVPDLRFLVRMALEDSGTFTVIAEAEDGVQAVELAGRHKPDLVILDLSMPRQDGLESLPKILATSPRSKVIVLSGFQAERLDPMVRAMGAVSYLEKGLPPAELVAAAKRAMDISNGVA
jgi:DNA-binding NarL/FixJ family response regulator